MRLRSPILTEPSPLVGIMKDSKTLVMLAMAGMPPKFSLRMTRWLSRKSRRSLMPYHASLSGSRCSDDEGACQFLLDQGQLFCHRLSISASASSASFALPSPTLLRGSALGVGRADAQLHMITGN